MWPKEGKMFTVHMVNFNMNKGTFPTLAEAVAQARALGFECAIFLDGEFVQSVKPY